MTQFKKDSLDRLVNAAEKVLHNYYQETMSDPDMKVDLDWEELRLALNHFSRCVRP